MEKIRAPRADAVSETDFVPTATEENVLAALHETTLTHKDKPRDDALIKKFHKDVEHCECFPLFQKYVSGEIPTLQLMFGNLKPFLDEFAEEIEKERLSGGSEEMCKWMSSTYKLISGREEQVRSSIQRYVNSVIRFRTLQKLAAGGTRDMTKQFVDADHARRRAHNILIEALQIFTAQVQALKNEGFDQQTMGSFPFRPWNQGEDARTLGKGSAVYFSGEVLNNRDFVRDWAIVADFKDQLDLLGDGTE